MNEEIVNHAVKALLYEVVVNPKPGLVDPVDPGAHHDMSIFTFIDSSLSLRTYFEQAAMIGQNYKDTDLSKMFMQLREAGKKAEKKMFCATKNVNTHKGTIFSLGIFVCAQSYSKKNQQNIFKIIKKMCKGLVEHDLDLKVLYNTSEGEKQYYCYGIGGARETAQTGYPIIEKFALPFLKKRTGTINQKLLDTLLFLATKTQDSTFIKRAGSLTKLSWLKKVSQHYLDLGGCQTKEGYNYLFQLNKIFKRRNYNLGGCADLLIVTIFLALEEKIV